MALNIDEEALKREALLFYLDNEQDPKNIARLLEKNSSKMSRFVQLNTPLLSRIIGFFGRKTYVNDFAMLNEYLNSDDYTKIDMARSRLDQSLQKNGHKIPVKGLELSKTPVKKDFIKIEKKRNGIIGRVAGAFGLDNRDLKCIAIGTSVPQLAYAFIVSAAVLTTSTDADASVAPTSESDTTYSQTIREPLELNIPPTSIEAKAQKTNKFFNLSGLNKLPIPEQRPILSCDAKYEPLLSLIRTKEANGNCNVAFGGKSYNLTSMSINSIRDFQDKLIAEGKPSSAMGCYQIIRSTMDFSSKLLGYTGKEIFTEETQKQMAIALLRHRGADKYLAGEMKLSTFVANLAKEWASFPKDEKGKSHYAGDGLNKALVSYERVVSAIDMSERISMTIDGRLDPITTASVTKQNPS